ncbi:MAG: phosphoserine transaminase [Legionellales bacterium RIFCSPHIGHO2_12_FULL_35_11]|nr:MAG: phosphoserine transaminase [Legionellales bacterium RIFCSPHIGHO2_12_FULL_35_11]
MKSRGYNFGAGPAALPEVILKQTQAELLNWQEKGMSILEIGHRTNDFMELMEKSQVLLRELLSIPQNYHVLFLGGATRMQFAMLPMNLLSKDKQAGYFISGVWSKIAYEECKHLKRAYCVASTENTGFTKIPEPINWQLQDNTAYVYFSSNETINGVQFGECPQFGDIPVISDMTSSFLSEPVNIQDYGVIFAGSQKNVAPAGLTIVIVKDELLRGQPEYPIPTMLDYRTYVKHNSFYATLPTFNCYMAYQMFEWIKEQGGVSELQKLNVAKAKKLYDYIDNNSFYKCNVDTKSRSIMNVCFTIANKDLEPAFIAKASDAGLLALKGHKMVGGLRASIYNSMPMAGVDALLNFMDEFAKTN